MNSFKDTAGREWAIIVTFATLKSVKAKHNINILDAIDPEWFRRVEADVFAAFDLVWAIIEPQAAKLAISQDQFAECMNGDTMEAANKALNVALLAFLPSGKRDVLAGAFAKADEARQYAMRKAIEELDKIDVNTMFVTPPATLKLTEQTITITINWSIMPTAAESKIPVRDVDPESILIEPPQIPLSKEAEALRQELNKEYANAHAEHKKGAADHAGAIAMQDDPDNVSADGILKARALRLRSIGKLRAVLTRYQYEWGPMLKTEAGRVSTKAIADSEKVFNESVAQLTTSLQSLKYDAQAIAGATPFLNGLAKLSPAYQAIDALRARASFLLNATLPGTVPDLGGEGPDRHFRSKWLDKEYAELRAAKHM